MVSRPPTLYIKCDNHRVLIVLSIWLLQLLSAKYKSKSVFIFLVVVNKKSTTKASNN
ncbi:hypothetical protein LINPERHAP1_LOCUS31545 [Linum perenne]